MLTIAPYLINPTKRGNKVDLIIQVNNTVYHLRGRTARAAYRLVTDRHRCQTADELGLYMNPPPPSRKSAVEAAYRAIETLRREVPTLVYKCAQGCGWRVASDVRLKVIATSADVKGKANAMIGSPSSSFNDKGQRP